MKRMIALLMVLWLPPIFVAAQVAETKVDEVTVVGTARHVPTTTNPTTYGAPAAGTAEPGLPPQRTLEPAAVPTATTRTATPQPAQGTSTRAEPKSKIWLWILLGAAVAGGIAASN